MSDLRLTFAANQSLQIQDLANGKIRPSGIELTFLEMAIEENNDRFMHFHEWEISEASFGNFCASMSQPDPATVALPIFTSRVFRHSALYVREGSDIKSPSDLKNRKIGIPQWSQTATIYVRGYLSHDCNVPLESVEWIQAGVNDPGRQETAKIDLPPGIRLRSRPDTTLGEMLSKGEIDAVISARPPDMFNAGTYGIRRLFPNYREEEERYFKKTGIFPIMHIIVLRRDAYEANRWIARNLLDAFDAAKRAAVRRLADQGYSYLPSACGQHQIALENGVLFGKGEPWPYGIEPNRKTLEAFLGYCHEQGVTKRRLTLEELFPKELSLTIHV